MAADQSSDPVPSDVIRGLLPPLEAVPPAPLPDKPKRKRPTKTLKESVKAPPPRPSLDAFLDHFFLIAGGPQQVAQMMFDEFRSAPAGSQIRGRVMETVLRTLKSADAKHKATDDLSIITDEDLERLMADREKEFAKHYTPEGTNEQQPAGPGDAGAPSPPPEPEAAG